MSSSSDQEFVLVQSVDVAAQHQVNVILEDVQLAQNASAVENGTLPQLLSVNSSVPNNAASNAVTDEHRDQNEQGVSQLAVQAAPDAPGPFVQQTDIVAADANTSAPPAQPRRNFFGGLFSFARPNSAQQQAMPFQPQQQQPGIPGMNQAPQATQAPKAKPMPPPGLWQRQARFAGPERTNQPQAVLDKMRAKPVSERHIVLDEEMQKEQNAGLLARVKAPASSTAQDTSSAGNAGLQEEETISLKVLAEFPIYNRGINEAVRTVVALQATKVVVKRSPISLTCILDHSGSMSGSKMEMVQKTMHFLIDLLGPDDYLGIIIYDDEAEEVLPLVRMSLGARAFAHAVIDGIRDDGSTNLYGGLVMGLMQQHEVAGNKELLKSVFLCTDGLANVGPSTSETILQSIKGDDRLQSAAMAVNVHTFGFGSDHDVKMLQSLSDWRDGEYYYIKDAKDIPPAFADVIGGLLSMVAKEVKLDIASLGGCTIKEVKAANKAERSGNEAQVQLGDVYAEENRDTLVILDLPVAEGNSSRILQARLQYMDVASGSLVSRSQVLEVARSESVVHNPKEGNEVVQTTAARFVTSEAMHEAAKLAEEGDIRAANLRLAQANIDIARYACSNVSPEYMMSAQATIQTVVDEGIGHVESQAMAKHWSKGLAHQRMGNVGRMTPLSSHYDSSSRAQTRAKSSKS